VTPYEMPIPESFMLLGHHIDVVWVPELIHEKGYVGESDYHRGIIALQPDTPSTPRSQAALEHTFLHEFIHWCYYVLGEHDLRTNEKHVDMMASLVHQMLVTAEYEEAAEPELIVARVPGDEELQ